MPKLDAWADEMTRAVLFLNTLFIIDVFIIDVFEPVKAAINEALLWCDV